MARAARYRRSEPARRRRSHRSWPGCREPGRSRGVASGNTIAAFRYSGSNSVAGAWARDVRTLSIYGATLTANAMQGSYVQGTSGDFAFAAGKVAGIDQTHMLLAKFDFDGDTTPYPYGDAGYYTTFSNVYTQLDPPIEVRNAEALCIDYKNSPGVGALIALGGYSYRDPSHGNDAVVCLFHEDSGAPVLRWSAWTKQSGTAYNVHDVCSAVRMDPKLAGVSSLNDFFVHAAGQFPTSSTDMNIRAAVFSSDDTGITEPANPGQKSTSGDPVDVSGTASGGDIPRAMQLNPFPDIYHNFIVVGDVWNGSSPGFDILTRRFRYTEPE